jgi:hypothetical protein
MFAGAVHITGDPVRQNALSPERAIRQTQSEGIRMKCDFQNGVQRPG